MGCVHVAGHENNAQMNIRMHGLVRCELIWNTRIDRPKGTCGMRRFVISAGIAVGCILGGSPCVVHGQAVPKIVGTYVTVYRPTGDRFAGPDTRELKAGEYYSDWVPNDHAILRGPDDRWHAFGITHPLTSAENIHDGEFQSFHAGLPAGS